MRGNWQQEPKDIIFGRWHGGLQAEVHSFTKQAAKTNEEATVFLDTMAYSRAERTYLEKFELKKDININQLKNFFVVLFKKTMDPDSTHQKNSVLTTSGPSNTF